MSGPKSAFAAIHNVNAEPELKFAAAMVASAAESARGGDCESYVWIERCSLRWLYAITPAWDDCERVRATLLATIPALECNKMQHENAGIAGEPSETSRYTVQLQIPGLEVHLGHGDCLQEVRPRAPTHDIRDTQGQLEEASVP